jgi:hypothetical protein
MTPGKRHNGSDVTSHSSSNYVHCQLCAHMQVAVRQAKMRQREEMLLGSLPCPRVQAVPRRLSPPHPAAAAPSAPRALMQMQVTVLMLYTSISRRSRLRIRRQAKETSERAATWQEVIISETSKHSQQLASPHYRCTNSRFLLILAKSCGSS